MIGHEVEYAFRRAAALEFAGPLAVLSRSNQMYALFATQCNDPLHPREALCRQVSRKCCESHDSTCVVGLIEVGWCVELRGHVIDLVAPCFKTEQQLVLIRVALGSQVHTVVTNTKNQRFKRVTTYHVVAQLELEEERYTRDSNVIS